MTVHANPFKGTNVEFDIYDPDKEMLYLPDGRALTNELCDELATQAEQTGPPADLVTAFDRRKRGLIPGGKSLSGGGKKSPRVEVILSEATHSKVKAAAKAAGMSKSRWLRKLVERELADA